MSQGNQTTSRAIPTTRKIIINDAAHMPQDYSTTPGGTIFSTTPGDRPVILDTTAPSSEGLRAIGEMWEGLHQTHLATDIIARDDMFPCAWFKHKLLIDRTRIIYDRKFLLQCRTSPLARTPPISLPDIPGVTSPVLAHPKQTSNTTIHSPQAQGIAEEDSQFEIDI